MSKNYGAFRYIIEKDVETDDHIRHEKTEETIEIVGFKNQLSFSYGDNNKEYFLEMKKGSGINPETKLEGLRRNNFFGTYLLGPMLVLNPIFMRYLLNILGLNDKEIPFIEIANKAYEIRLGEFKGRT